VILVVVAHPDDEAIWFGASICGLVNDLNQQVTVLCLSGHDPDSSREDEFAQSQRIAGFQNGKVLGGALRKAGEPLPSVKETLEKGLKDLSISLNQIQIVITHSPYGDEHRHPHHVQSFKSLNKWCKSKNKPLAFFTTIPIPAGSMKPFLRGLMRSNLFHVTNISRCNFGPIERLKYFNASGTYTLPKFYFQFVGQTDRKIEMLRSYHSVDQDLFESGYGMFTCNAESLYVLSHNGYHELLLILGEASYPSTDQLFGQIRYKFIALRNHTRLLVKRARTN
jgi:LmbE family N-acetylglucosaminyl deacetylase